MSKEIVSRLLTNKKQMIFESAGVSGDNEEVLLGPGDNQDIEETEEIVTSEEGTETEVSEESVSEENTIEYEPCVCGSTDVSIEDGKAVCNACGRDLTVRELSEPLLPRYKKDAQLEESELDRDAKLRNVVAIWRQGKYQRAMELCKRYGISDREFAFALVRGFRESEEVDELDKDAINESTNDIGYIVAYTYDGDELSDYEGKVLVAATSDREAIQKAEKSIRKKKLDARHFYVLEKVPSIKDWKKKYPKTNTEILESKILKKISQEEGLKNESNKLSTIRMSTPANKLGMDLSTVEDYGNLEDMEDDHIKDARKQPNLYNYSYSSQGTASPARESRNLTEGTSIDSTKLQSMKPGTVFKNAGNTWKILALKGDYVLVHSSDRKYTPYVVAWSLDPRDGSWGQGHYFDDENSAMRYLKRQSGILKEDAEMEIISPNEEDSLGKNIIRAIQTPVSTAGKPNLDAAIMEAMRVTESVERTYTESELIKYLKNSTTSPVYIRTSYVKAGWDDVQFAANRAGYRVSKLVGRKDLLNKLGLSGTFADFYQFTKKNYKYMQESADVDISKWSYSTKKTKPSGYGMWFFKIGNEEVQFSGMYADCKKKAIQYANQRRIQKIILLP